MDTPLHVVAGVIRGADGRILLSLRPPRAEHGGLWEFPGGKLHEGESRLAALARELREELGIDLETAAPLITVRHRYPAREVLLDVWDVLAWTGQPSGREGQTIRWVAPEALATLDFPAANHPVVSAAGLPRLHLVTPDPGVDDEAFLRGLEHALRRDARLVQFRAPGIAADRYRVLARAALTACHARGARLLLNAAPELVLELGAHGVHLPRAVLLATTGRPLPAPYLISAACHDSEALVHAAAIGADFALLSPVQTTRTHPQARPLGWAATTALVASATLPVYALGGLGTADLPQAVRAGCQGVAGIRGLWEGEEALGERQVLASF